MAAFNYFDDTTNQLAQGKHLLNSDTWDAVLTNSAPIAGNTILSNITQIANGNGYTTDGINVTRSGSFSGSTYTVSGTSVTWTGGASAMATFRYVVMVNMTTSSPVKPLVGWWDYGSAVALNPGETFTAKWNNVTGAGGTILTLGHA